MSDQKNQIESALNAAKQPFIQLVNGLSIAFLPMQDGAWTLKELSHLRTTPARKMGNTHLIVDADYDKNRVKFKAILNGNDGIEAGFSDFIAHYEPAKTVDWVNWLQNDKQKMNQEQFAHFLENNIANISCTDPSEPEKKYPSAADLLEFCTNLEMTSTVRFRSATKIQNGQVQFEYVEEGTDQTKGKLALFETFGIGVQPFIGDGPAFFIEAKLRFRINRESGALSLWYELNRPDKALEVATKALIKQVEEESQVPVYFGNV
ncbi:MAG: DUF2303 family protein [Proteobacteria bacterium]|nr:DUF2303 family protein [Pseudomonadota bacterium]